MKRSRLCCKCLFLCLTWEQHHPVTRLLAVWGSSAEFALLFTVFVSYFEMPRGLGLHGTNRMNWEVASAVNCVLCCDDLLTGCGETAWHPCNVHCLLDTAVSAIHLPSFFTSWNKNVHYQHFSAAALFWVRESEATACWRVGSASELPEALVDEKRQNQWHDSNVWNIYTKHPIHLYQECGSTFRESLLLELLSKNCSPCTI